MQFLESIDLFDAEFDGNACNAVLGRGDEMVNSLRFSALLRLENNPRVPTHKWSTNL